MTAAAPPWFSRPGGFWTARRRRTFYIWPSRAMICRFPHSGRCRGTILSTPWAKKRSSRSAAPEQAARGTDDGEFKARLEPGVCGDDGSEGAQALIARGAVPVRTLSDWMICSPRSCSFEVLCDIITDSFPGRCKACMTRFWAAFARLRPVSAFRCWMKTACGCVSAAEARRAAALLRHRLPLPVDDRRGAYGTSAGVFI